MSHQFLKPTLSSRPSYFSPSISATLPYFPTSQLWIQKVHKPGPKDEYSFGAKEVTPWVEQKPPASLNPSLTSDHSHVLPVNYLGRPLTGCPCHLCLSVMEKIDCLLGAIGHDTVYTEIIAQL